ncbi:hypothetical protein CHS0354_004956 [Potamilus streckersoni]|uniref:Peptidase S72 domain-containing protein n=1 Tax=Potamilus streckersoni TaxID=2493646 RepID=A0AAE0RNH3_9BIVA|nr:hypothetical protein CHS0354_004956 [Potamilus streckersoni]
MEPVNSCRRMDQWPLQFLILVCGCLWMAEGQGIGTTTVDPSNVELNVQDRRAIVGHLFEYQLGDAAFHSVYKINTVTERGEKKLPDWMSYNETSYMLHGVPMLDAVGKLYLQVEAQCKTQAPYCSNIEETFIVTVIEQVSSPSRGTLDKVPVLQNPVNYLQVMTGVYFEFKVPANTFIDKEDGQTPNLTLIVRRPFGELLHASSWLIFNQDRQMLYGVPLIQDLHYDEPDHGKQNISSITLTAEDSAGNVARDSIYLAYNNSLFSEITHRFVLTLNKSFEGFMSMRENLVKFAKHLAYYFEDVGPGLIVFLDVKPGSVHISWSNISLSGSSCKRDDIMNLLKRITYNNSLHDEFVSKFGTEFDPVSANVEFVGTCTLPPILQVVPTKPPPTPQMDKDRESFLIQVVLPVVAAVLFLIILILIIYLVYRHRRSGSTDVLKSEKPTFLEDRRPIIFPEELEMVDPSLKPRQPSMIPTDYIQDHPPEDSIGGSRNNLAPPGYQLPYEENDLFYSDNQSPPPPPLYGSTHSTEPPPYRLPPPYPLNSRP